MRSKNSIVIVVALAVVGAAWSVPWTAQANCPSSSAGPGQPVSWYVEWESQQTEDLVMVAVVMGPTGVVITDYQANGFGFNNRLVQRDDDGDSVKWRVDDASTPRSLRSGVPFCRGSSIVLVFERTSEDKGYLLISGYTY